MAGITITPKLKRRLDKIQKAFEDKHGVSKSFGKIIEEALDYKKEQKTK